ncbi:MAG: enoyl-CoA hydratase/isomerase family protein [Acidobacteria bacterium]|nr:enoyl-CoA hydratase/isomerase family protein [Acidobacteriota bacterium]
MKMLDIARHGHVLLLTLDRPAKRNSLHPELIRQLSDALTGAHSDPETRVVVVTGAGASFCAGLDLDHLLELDAEGRVEYMRSAFALFRRVHDLRQPVLAAVNGPAIAGGFDLAAFCDLRFCSPDALFGQTEILLGLTQILYPLYKIIGLSHARYLAMTGTTIDAEEAFRIGLVNRIFPAGELLDETLQIAKTLAARPPRALFDTKQLSRQLIESDTDTAFAQMLETITSRLRSPEHREALGAYREQLRHKPKTE